MQDNDAIDADPQDGAQDEAQAKAELSHDREREQLLRARRARQGSSSRSTNARLLMTAALLVAGVGGIAIVAGPAQALKIFGFGGSGGGQQTSKVGLNVADQPDEAPKLDFIVPANAAVKPSTPDTGLNDKIKALQTQIADLERSSKPGMSSADIQGLLKDYNDTVVQKLDAERKAMADENARLQSEADKANEARQRADEAARLQAEAQAARDRQDQTQRESSSVVLDNHDDANDVADADGTRTGTGTGTGQERDQNLRFLKSNASSVVQTSVSAQLADPSHMVVQGTIISAVLETAIDTTLPGTLRAQVTEPVYSFDGTRVMMPAGTILIGAFNNDVEQAQSRVMIAWNRAVTPAGKSIALGSIGTDLLGRSGTPGNVDNRYLTKFGAAALISAITAVPTMLASQQKSSSNSGSSGTTLNINGGSTVGSDVGTNVGGQASDVLGKYLALPPVIRVPQGEEIRIFVNRDLVFK